MKVYLNLLRDILEHGVDRDNRTDTSTRSVFGRQMRFDLTQGFPLITTKKIITKSVIHELLWFLKGKTNIQYLKKNGVGIWDAWANEAGELGPVYGKQWRAWSTIDGNTIDQIKQVIEQIQNDPHSRRHIVSAWNVADIKKMALPPCHLLFQFYVVGQRLSCQLYMRSADVFLGVPFNIASYALLTTMIAQLTHLQPYEFILTMGDAHIYHNHFAQVKEQLKREPLPLSQLIIKRQPQTIDDYQFDDFEFINYIHHPRIIAPIAV